MFARGAAGCPAARVEGEADEDDQHVVEALGRLVLPFGQVVAQAGAQVGRSGEHEAREHVDRDVRRDARWRD